MAAMPPPEEDDRHQGEEAPLEEGEDDRHQVLLKFLGSGSGSYSQSWDHDDEEMPPNVPMPPPMSPHVESPPDVPAHRVVSSEGKGTGEGWSCPSCTYLNLLTAAACEMCEAVRLDDRGAASSSGGGSATDGPSRLGRAKSAIKKKVDASLDRARRARPLGGGRQIGDTDWFMIALEDAGQGSSAALVIDIKDQKKGRGGDIIVWPASENSDNQLWRSKSALLVLDIAEKSRNEGAPLVAWPPGGAKATNQKFTLPRAQEEDDAMGPGTISCFMHGLFLTVECEADEDGAAVQPGARVCMHQRAGHGAARLRQRWRIILV